jgi:hypothetical protein
MSFSFAIFVNTLVTFAVKFFTVEITKNSRKEHKDY